VISYLREVKRLLMKEAYAVIQYSDKTKEGDRTPVHSQSFSDMTPDRMVDLAGNAGLTVIEEDRKTLWHSSVVRLCADT
jgi:hypothetical protein